MKKLKYLLIATIGILAITVSCSDEFLLKTPQGSIAGSTIANAAGLEGKLIAAYRTISGQGMNGGGTWYYDIHGWIFGGIASDNALKGTDAGDHLSILLSNSMTLQILMYIFKISGDQYIGECLEQMKL
tara:strand:- start:110 stop:496 length:387 start_codon:yes stop_codon:yes gene_type:complete